MSTILHLLRGQMSSPVNHLGGRCPHIPFFTGGADVRGGKCPAPETIHYLIRLALIIHLKFWQITIICF